MLQRRLNSIVLLGRQLLLTRARISPLGVRKNVQHKTLNIFGKKPLNEATLNSFPSLYSINERHFYARTNEMPSIFKVTFLFALKSEVLELVCSINEKC